MENTQQLLRMEIHPPYEDFKYWVVTFPQLAVGSQGETIGIAIDNAIEALQLWVEGCLELGTLDVVLEKCGFGDILKKSIKNDIPLGIIPPTYLESVTCHA